MYWILDTNNNIKNKILRLSVTELVSESRQFPRLLP